MISYFGGMFGEFTCIQISSDKNFYPINLKKVDDNNRYYCDNPLTSHFSSLKTFHFAPDVKPLSQPILEKINHALLEKNLCFPTHYYHETIDNRFDNLPKLKPVRMFTEHRDILILGYCCGWIKSLLDERDLYSRRRSFVDEFESYATTPEITKLYEHIKIREKFYWFEKVALKHKHTDLNEFVDYWWLWYQKFNFRKSTGWHHIDIGNCFKNYNNTKDEWKNYFGLDDYLNKETLASYHQGNLDLIERKLGIPFEQFINTDWIKILKDWIRATATDSALL